MDEELIGGAEVGLDLERDELPAALGRGLEDGEAEDLSVEMEGNVAPEFFRIVLQYLKLKGRGFKSQNRIDFLLVKSILKRTSTLFC